MTRSRFSPRCGVSMWTRAPGAGRQRFLEHVGLRQVVAEQDERGRRAVFVELGDEGLEHFGVGEVGVGARAEGVVAPVLVGAEEEDLHAELAGFVVDGEDVGLLDGLRGASPVRSGPAPGAERRSRSRAARSKSSASAAWFMSLSADGPARTWTCRRGTGALPRPARDSSGCEISPVQGAEQRLIWCSMQGRVRAGVEAVRAGAQQERLLQRGDGALDGGGRGEGAEIVALAPARAAMLGELGRFVLGGDEDVGEALVVAQQHVEARASGA